MSTESNNNGFLYFLSGVLLVAVCVVGYMAFIANERNESITEVTAASIESAAGEMEDAADDAQESTSELSIEMDDDGFSASQTTETDN